MASVARTAATADTAGRYARYGWAVLAYNILVVLWGALVRATGSGAGCGDDWPLCQGAVVPVMPGLHTAIEFTHRVTSGLAFLSVIGLYVWARRGFAAGHASRRAAFFGLIFMINETLIGAVLVLLGLVAGNRSPWRGVVLAVHLANTLLLLAAIALSAWWSTHPGPAWRGPVRRPLAFAAAALILTSAAGGLAALGDTLFPAASVAAGIEQEFSRSAPLWVRLRILHPLIAIGGGAYLMWLAARCQAAVPHPDVRRWGNAVVALTLVQWLAGGVNILLLTPVWMQLTHLLFTDLLWISLVLFAAAVLAAQAACPAYSKSAP